MKKNSVSEFELEKQDFKIKLKRGGAGMAPMMAADEPQMVAYAPVPSMMPAPAAPMNVRLEIPHLSVEGYTAAQQTRFMRTLESALRTLAAQPRDWSSFAANATNRTQNAQNVHNVHIAHIAPLTPRPGSTPEETARELARRLFSRLPAATATERHHA